MNVKHLIEEQMMNRNRKVAKNVVLGVMLPIVWLSGMDAAFAGQPRSGTATVSRSGAAGNSSTRVTNVATTGTGGYKTSSTYTGPAGNTTTRQSSGSYNAATQSFNRSATTTLPGGKTVTSNGQASYNPATGTVSQGRTTTGPNGATATESRTVAAGQP